LDKRGRLCLNEAKASTPLALLQRFRTPFVEPPAEEPARLGPRSRSIGEILRDRREELDLDLETIGATLRIKPAYLVALEQDRTHELPGATYAMGFIKAYSRYLGLDEQAVLSRFKDESAGFTARQDLSLPVPLGERSLPGAAMLLIALILGLCGYGTWYYLSTGERNRPERVTSVPQDLQPPPTAAQQSSGGITLARGLPPASGSAASTADATRTSASAAAAADASASSPSLGAPAQTQSPSSSPAPRQDASGTPAPQFSVPPANKPEATAAAGSPPPANAAAPTPPPAAAGDASRVSIKALSDCWIQVRASDDSIVFSKVLKAGETYKVPPKQGLSLRTGNAGALQLSVDGKPVPSIGGIGAMRRNVALDPSELTAGTAVHG
jgi:cytoskeleton protein RodZ